MVEKLSASFHLSVLDTMAAVVPQLMIRVLYCCARILRLPGHGILKLILLIIRKAKEG